MIIVYQQTERLIHSCQPKSCHIVIIAGINKMDSGSWIIFCSFINLCDCFLITIAVCPTDILKLNPGYLSVFPEFFFSVNSGEIHQYNGILFLHISLSPSILPAVHHDFSAISRISLPGLSTPSSGVCISASRMASASAASAVFPVSISISAS